jgi:hypothetical protein
LRGPHFSAEVFEGYLLAVKIRSKEMREKRRKARRQEWSSWKEKGKA